jgi:hypothetical protein
MGRAMMFDGTRSGEAREGALQGKRVSEWLFETRPQFVSIIPNLAAAAAARSSCHLASSIGSSSGLAAQNTGHSNKYNP